ncbi:MAG: NUDIX hydrolase [Lachnospiraceae bacterium]|nr:NUDIX hydrolase [Lachnospiraceae bacterium]
MKRYQMNEEEKQFLSRYDISDFERPSVAADMAIYSIMEEGRRENFRKLPPKALKILLIKRASYPYKDCWALPGGFCRPDESIYETAKRELYEETNVEAAYLELAGVFGDIGRDPRGWIISNTFLSLIDADTCELRAGTDAWEAKWFTIETRRKEIKKEVTEETAEIETEYTLLLSHEETGISLAAKIRERQQFKHYHETVYYEILESDQLAFDHGKLILHTLLFLRKSLKNDLRIGFDLMPGTFTLTGLQSTFELVLDQKLLTPNFRRKINDYVVETDEVVEGEGFRPAKLFKRNVEEFYQ